MTYVPSTRTAAQREADRKADEQWMKNHGRTTVQDDSKLTTAGWGAAALVGHPAAAAH